MIRNAPDLSPPSPRWRKDAPPSLLCVASNGSVCTVLDSIGPNVDITDEAGEDLSDWLSSGEPLPPGIWVGTLVVNHYETDTYYGREWDMEMDFTDVREATDEEVIHISQGETPWDPSQWIENWTEVQEGPSSLSRMKASLRALPSEDGWLESSGPDFGFPKSRAVPRDLISWAETWLSSAIEKGLPYPYIYPTFEGAISAEWSGKGKELSILFRQDLKGDFSCVSVDTAEEEEVTLIGLDLNSPEDTAVILRLVSRFLEATALPDIFLEYHPGIDLSFLLEGNEGKSVDKELVPRLETWIPRALAAGLPEPKLSPMQNGGVLMEWPGSDKVTVTFPTGNSEPALFHLKVLHNGRDEVTASFQMGYISQSYSLVYLVCHFLEVL